MHSKGSNYVIAELEDRLAALGESYSRVVNDLAKAKEKIRVLERTQRSGS